MCKQCGTEILCVKLVFAHVVFHHIPYSYIVMCLGYMILVVQVLAEYAGIPVCFEGFTHQTW
jgi:hypothetical protein